MNSSDLWLRLRALFHRKRADHDLKDELDFHIQMLTRKNQSRGVDSDEARRQAWLRFGGLSRVEEECRDERRVRLIENVVQDLRLAIRRMSRDRGLTAVALISLALGIGANAAIFTLMNAVFLRSLPVRNPAGLLLLGDARSQGFSASIHDSVSAYSWDLYKHLRDADILESLAAFQSADNTVFSIRRPGWTSSSLAVVKPVSGNYFGVLGVDAAMGRTIATSDDLESATPTAVVSYRYWMERLDGSSGVVGSTISINGSPFSIIGVAAKGFFGDTLQPNPPSLWVPVSSIRRISPEAGSALDMPDMHWLYLIGRLKPGVSSVQARERLTAALQNWALSREGSNPSPEDLQRIKGTYIEFTPGGGGISHMRRDYSQTLWLLLGISLAVLTITCVNLANLLLARGTGRRIEDAVRHALGASRGRLIQQSMTESLTLAIAGGALGLMVGSEGVTLLLTLLFGTAHDIPIPTTPDIRVLAFTFVLSCAAAIFFGLLPALRVNAEIAPEIRRGSPGISGSALSLRRFGIGKTLIVLQVALALVVLAGAGSFARSLENLSHQSFGYNREHALIVRVDPIVAGYKYEQLGALYERLLSRLNAIAGVKSASLSTYSPFNGCCWSFSIAVEGLDPKENDDASAMLNRVSPRYFESIGTRVLQGRVFNERDTPGSQPVAVVNEVFVRHYIPGGNPIGKHFGIGNESTRNDIEIIGVVENAKYTQPRDDSRPMAFLPLLQLKAGAGAMRTGQYGSNFISAIELRSANDPAAIAHDVRQVLTEIDPGLLVINVTTLSDDVLRSLSRETVIAILAVFFGVLALVLACVGLYGLMAYIVQRRTGEIGIRIALGADRGQVIEMVLREALAQAITGVFIGIPVAFVTLHLVANQLFGVNPMDVRDSAIAALALVLCITVAAFIPAYRASRVDPLVALRHNA